MDKNQADKKPASFFGTLAKDLFFGCMTLVPLALFAAAVYYLVRIVLSVCGALFGLTESAWTSAVILALVVVALVYTGRKLRRREKWLFNLVESGIARIPIIGGWYTAVRDLVQTFTTGGDKDYLGTVRVAFGSGYMIGFVTSREAQEDGSVQVTVFVPTSPNPTTGLVFFFPEEDVRYLDMPPAKAFANILSLGMKG